MLSMPRCFKRIEIDLTGEENIIKTIDVEEKNLKKRNFTESLDYISISEEEETPIQKKAHVENDCFTCADVDLDEMLGFYTPDFFDISYEDISFVI